MQTPPLKIASFHWAYTHKSLYRHIRWLQLRREILAIFYRAIGRSVKRQWCNRKRRFSVLSDAESSEALQIKPTLLYSII